MAVSKKISSQIGQQLPDFIRSDAPLFQSFIEGYFLNEISFEDAAILTS